MPEPIASIRPASKRVNRSKPPSRPSPQSQSTSSTAARSDYTVNDLAALGVRRISVGGTMARVAMHAFIQSARQIAQDGKFDSFAGIVPNAELNKFFHDDLQRRPKT